ncbi:MAG: CotH kinase family protein [Steroidobacteraceae bacterium]
MSAIRCFQKNWLMTGLLSLLAACGGGGNDGSTGNGNGTGTAPAVSLSITPIVAQVQSGDSVTLTVTAANTDIVWPTSVAGTFTHTGNTATYTPPSVAGRYEFTVKASADSAKTATAVVQVLMPDPAVSLSITPTTSQVQSGGSVTLTVMAANTDIIWPTSVNGAFTHSGNTATYTPPTAAGHYEFIVAASANPSITATASVEVVAGTDPATISLSITPTSTQVESLDSVALTVAAANTDIVWPTSVAGTFTHSGNTATYTPPAAAGHYEFTVAASANPSITATASVEVFVPQPAEITSFSLPPPLSAGSLDEAAGLISFTATEWIDGLDALRAEFAASGQVTVNGITQVSGTTENNFYRDVSYTVATGKFVQRTYTVRIKSPQTTGLPVMRIDTQGGAEINSKENYLQTNVTVVDPADPTHSFAHGDYKDQVRGRGNSTWDYPKKPYRLKFDKKTSMFGLEAAKSWVLLANYQDPTLLLNSIALEMGLRFGLPFPHHSFPVELFVNGRYVGNYLLTEQNQTGKGRVDIDENDGFLVELDQWYDEEPKFRSMYYSLPIMIKTPEDLPDPSGYDFVKNAINDLEFAMNDSSLFPGGGYRDLINMGTFVDFIMINEMVGNDEIGWPKSSYMYKDSDANGGKISMGPLWDFDWAFGYSCYGFQYFAAADQLIGKHNFFLRFFEDPLFVAQYKARWEQMRGQVQGMESYIRDMAAKLQRSQEENFRVWPETRNNGYPREIDDLVDWWQRRFQYLDQYISTGDLQGQSSVPRCSSPGSGS